MPFKGNASEKAVISTRKLYTGLGNFKIVALNPDEKEREKLGITQKIGDYTGEDKNGNKQTRLDFWLDIYSAPYPSENLVREDVKKMGLQKLSIFVADRTLTSNANPKNQYWINKIGICTWSEGAEVIKANPKMDWFDTDDLRLAHAGEEQLTKLLIALLNVDVREEGAMCRIDDPKKIANGNIKEIKTLISGWKDNTVQCLLGVKKSDSGTFQDFYKEFFGRTSSKLNTLEAWQRQIKDDRQGLGSRGYETFHIDSLKFSLYTPPTDIGQGSEAGAGVPSQSDANYPAAMDEAPPF